MKVYKVNYYTLSRGKEPDGEAGNLRQFTDTAYIQCKNISCVEVLLKNYYKKPRYGKYYQPVIHSIIAVDGHCVLES